MDNGSIWGTLISWNLGMLLGGAAIFLVIGWASARNWLKENKFEIITVDREEQIQYLQCKLILLEPGRVLVHEGATRTISKLKKASIEVTEVAFSETLKFASGMHCATMEVYREPGPLLKDIIS